MQLTAEIGHCEQPQDILANYVPLCATRLILPIIAQCDYLPLNLLHLDKSTNTKLYLYNIPHCISTVSVIIMHDDDGNWLGNYKLPRNYEIGYIRSAKYHTELFHIRYWQKQHISSDSRHLMPPLYLKR